jgi:prepilin-type N-terminal cleavage/methylation domain-containing protein
MKFEVRNSKSEIRVLRSALRVGFTLIELLTVIVIIGILAAVLAPAVSHLLKGDNTLAATRQMLDDCARARQMAISQRTTVYMVFIPTNFWNDPYSASGNPGGSWAPLGNARYAPDFRASTVVTQLYAAQLNGYMMTSLRGVGDQPGRFNPKDLVRVKTLPDKAFFAPFKFLAPTNGAPNLPYPTNRPDLRITGFLKTSVVPFPTVDMLTNGNIVSDIATKRLAYVTLPYIAFNYLGQLTPGDGSVLDYDENIPLAYGSVVNARNQTNKAPIQGLPTFAETPPGNSTNISYNIIHIDRLTGRARLERQEVK